MDDRKRVSVHKKLVLNTSFPQAMGVQDKQTNKLAFF
jgi:hypothetical protein